MRNRTMILSFVGVALGVGFASAAQIPLAVSPGDPGKLALVEARCPTFSWAAVNDAQGYELVVYRAEEDAAGGEPVLLESLAGAVTAWTPSLDRCLERSGRYAWSVRAIGPEGPTAWSAAALFQVAAGSHEPELKQALEVVRRYLVAEAASAGLGDRIETSPGPDEEVSASEAETRALGGNTQFRVESGNLGVTSPNGRAYIQLDTRFDVAPAAEDCNQVIEAGRMLLVMGLTTDLLYVCTGNEGWEAVVVD